uniref:Uncharacterized protein n=1 Tax=Anguilla anguilla TaxID=7936 RepID=A0A0E9TJP5_ANGAN
MESCLSLIAAHFKDKNKWMANMLSRCSVCSQFF